MLTGLLAELQLSTCPDLPFFNPHTAFNYTTLSQRWETKMCPFKHGYKIINIFLSLFCLNILTNFSPDQNYYIYFPDFNPLTASLNTAVIKWHHKEVWILNYFPHIKCYGEIPFFPSFFKKKHSLWYVGWLATILILMHYYFFCSVTFKKNCNIYRKKS